MGHVVPDRLFWAQAETDDADASDDAPEGPASVFEFPPHDTQH
jgi:hydroxymethylpyrimidine/phosphomethylpyrimidine kinase